MHHGHDQHDLDPHQHRLPVVADDRDRRAGDGQGAEDEVEDEGAAEDLGQQRADEIGPAEGAGRCARARRRRRVGGRHRRRSSISSAASSAGGGGRRWRPDRRLDAEERHQQRETDAAAFAPARARRNSGRARPPRPRGAMPAAACLGGRAGGRSSASTSTRQALVEHRRPACRPCGRSARSSRRGRASADAAARRRWHR